MQQYKWTQATATTATNPQLYRKTHLHTMKWSDYADLDFATSIFAVAKSGGPIGNILIAS